MFQPIQFILITFLVFAISRVFLRSRDGSLSLGEFIFWASLFSAAAFGVIEPSFTSYIAQLLGIGRGADIAVYFSIVLLFYLIFRTNIMIENLRHEITKLVREIALTTEAKSPPKKPKPPLRK